MHKISSDFPYSIFPVAGADVFIVLLYALKYFHILQINLSGKLLYAVAIPITLVALFSPAHILASLNTWKRKSSHRYGYDEQDIYQDRHLVISWKEVESVVFQQKSDSWVRLRLGVWTEAAYASGDASRGKAMQRLHGSITFYPKRGFGFSQVEVTIPITEKAAPMKRLYRKMKTLVASAGWDSVFDIILK